MTDLAIKFQNTTVNTTFQLGKTTGCDNVIISGTNNWNTYPAPALAPGTMQSMSMSVLASLANRTYDIYCTWIAPKSNVAFGIKIHVPVQVIDIGTAPYWYVFYGQDTAPEWRLPGNDPAVIYTWPAAVGFRILASPTASHSSLSIDVAIMDL